MPFVLAGLLLLWLLSVATRGFVRGNPKIMARTLRRLGGAAALLVAIVMMVRGRFDIALGLAALGFWLIKTDGAPLASALGGSFKPKPRPRRVSRVRSAMIEMELDLASGAMAGTVLAGPEEGASLDTLSRVRCFGLFRRCRADDPEGARLLEAYFDRRFAGWREAAEFDHDAGRAQTGGRARGPVRMPDHEAYHVLGLREGASREEITRAHRRLMKEYHPDHGGSTAMAARVNEAKDVLMRRHP